MSFIFLRETAADEMTLDRLHRYIVFQNHAPLPYLRTESDEPLSRF